MTWLGRPEEAIELIKQAMKLNPYHPPRFWGHLGRAYYSGQHYSKAVSAIGHIAEPDVLQCSFLAASHACLEDISQATRYVDAALRQNSDLTIKELMTMQHYGQNEDIEHFRNGLSKAGFPD